MSHQFALVLHNLELTHVARLVRIEVASVLDHLSLLLVVHFILTLLEFLHDFSPLS